MRLSTYQPDFETRFPVSGGGSALVTGCALYAGATPATMNGFLLGPATGTSAIPDMIGILREAHATADDTNVAGTVFKTHPVDLLNAARPVRIEISQATADLITATQAVSTTTMTVTSLEDDIDASFLYVNTGTGAGQTNYLTAATAGACTLKAAFTTSLDATSKFIKILRRFHKLVSLTTDGTKLSSQAAVGAVKAVVLDLYITRNGKTDQLDPTKHSALTGLNSLRDVKFHADILFRDTLPYTVV